MTEVDQKHTGIFQLLLIPLLLCISFILFTSKVEAQTDISIGLYPTSEKLKLKPGEKFNGELVTWNLSTESARYKIVAKGFRQIENKPGTAIILSDEEELQSLYSASSWITLSKDSIDLIPNKNEKILYEINVPNNITKGEYHAIISLISENALHSSNTSTLTTLSSGLPILIQVGDNFIENAELLEFKTDSKFYESPTVQFTTRINNIGDTHIAPTGEIVLQNIFNKEIGRIKFNQDSQTLLRDNIGNYTTDWKAKLFTEEKQIAIGPIKANLLLTYREFQPGFAPLLAETSFWIIPWKYIVIILVAILLIIALIQIRKYKKRSKPS